MTGTCHVFEAVVVCGPMDVSIPMADKKNMGGTHGGLHYFHYWQQWQQWHLVKISITHWIPLIRSGHLPASATALLGPPGETLCHG